MQITRDMLLERRHSLEVDSIAISGAIQQIDWELEILDSDEGETPLPGEEAPED